MSVTSKIGALFFQHHQPESKRVKKSKHKRPRLNKAPAAPLVRVQNGPPISVLPQAAPSIVPPPPTPFRPAVPQIFDGVPDDLPSVVAPPPGTPAVEEPDTLGTNDLDTGNHGIGGFCGTLCCRPCE